MSRTTKAPPRSRLIMQSSGASQDGGTTRPIRRRAQKPADAGTNAAASMTSSIAPSEPAVGTEVPPPCQQRLGKLDRLVDLLRVPAGASLAELAVATGWQAHSVRGAIAGSLKRKGHVVTSEKSDGIRRYRIKALS